VSRHRNGEGVGSGEVAHIHEVRSRFPSGVYDIYSHTPQALEVDGEHASHKDWEVK
jgi:hypothetical protein